MLTNLDFLNTGEKFPPVCEQRRMEMYQKNRELFESEHSEVYREELKRIERVIGNFENIISYPVVVNFQKEISLTLADLLLGEPPLITADNQKMVDLIVANGDSDEDLICTANNATIDYSRYGDGLFHVYKDGEQPVIETLQPRTWFPVVSEDNIKKMRYHVLAWCYGDNERLKVQIHSKGSYEEREYSINKGIIGEMISLETIKTGLKDFAIIQVSNTQTSDRITGIDDYTDVDSIIADIMVRIGQIDRILDKHASPSVTGPQEALEQDPVSGEWRLKMGNYFPRINKDSPEVKYITWEGQLAANFTQLEKLINLLYTISEMGSAIFGDMTGTTGQVASGIALRRLMIKPLSKTARARRKFDYAIKKAIRLCSQLNGKELTNVNITWQDGLPIDELEQATIMMNRTANKATISQLTAIKMLSNLNDAKADEELSRILDDEAVANPLNVPNIGGNDNPIVKQV